MNKSTFTIAVSGPSGSGKSTLTKQLRDKLVDAISFHFDDYASTHTYPDDFVVCIDIPLEISLARRILRGIQSAEYSPSETLNNFEEYLSQYLRVMRNLYQAINSNVMADCDLVVSGLEPIDVITDRIIVELEKRGII